MVKPPARPLIRCAPVCLAAALFVGGVALPGVALPGVALAASRAAAPDGLPPFPVPRVALPRVESLLPPLAPVPPSAAWRYLDPLLPAGELVGRQPFDPDDGWFAPEEPSRPEPEEPPDEPDAEAPDEEVPDVAPPVPPAQPMPAPSAAPARPPAAPPAATTAPQPRPASPTPRHRRSATPSPADTRGLDELFPDRPSTATEPGADGNHDTTAGAEPAGYGRPLIYSGIAGLLVSALGIAFVLNRRRGW
ncbi:hypothetical protein [Asanoa siamensis]|uniref:Uncharacterized protein n=1 Tax=Asanoa siamensis TaxID=926357 RepID=A0ABQ4D1T3_9ACTN|nr:hypothetical protein [Asanoa siamensis]GIF77466.1 hypothetical protein Asi02nite_69840 [Asanoa siamensis]